MCRWVAAGASCRPADPPAPPPACRGPDAAPAPVPPARHRRARCRVVLRYADAAEVDVTFLMAAGVPGSPSRHGYDRQIRRWLAAGRSREDAWLVPDPAARDGVALDLRDWVATV